MRHIHSSESWKCDLLPVETLPSTRMWLQRGVSKYCLSQQGWRKADRGRQGGAPMGREWRVRVQCPPHKGRGMHLCPHPHSPLCHQAGGEVRLTFTDQFAAKDLVYYMVLTNSNLHWGLVRKEYIGLRSYRLGLKSQHLILKNWTSVSSSVKFK